MPDIRSLPTEQVVARGRGMLDFNAQPAHKLREVAADLYRRSDNIPLGRGGTGIDRVGALRDLADALTARAETLETTDA